MFWVCFAHAQSNRKDTCEAVVNLHNVYLDVVNQMAQLKDVLGRKATDLAPCPFRVGSEQVEPLSNQLAELLCSTNHEYFIYNPKFAVLTDKISTLKNELATWHDINGNMSQEDFRWMQQHMADILKGYDDAFLSLPDTCIHRVNKYHNCCCEKKDKPKKEPDFKAILIVSRTGNGRYTVHNAGKGNTMMDRIFQRDTDRKLPNGDWASVIGLRKKGPVNGEPPGIVPLLEYDTIDEFQVGYDTYNQAPRIMAKTGTKTVFLPEDHIVIRRRFTNNILRAITPPFLMPKKLDIRIGGASPDL